MISNFNSRFRSTYFNQPTLNNPPDLHLTADWDNPSSHWQNLSETLSAETPIRKTHSSVHFPFVSSSLSSFVFQVLICARDRLFSFPPPPQSSGPNSATTVTLCLTTFLVTRQFQTLGKTESERNPQFPVISPSPPGKRSCRDVSEPSLNPSSGTVTEI